jgi:prepilin-type N-terminal cleavage/methylation domain-containing protein
MRRRSFNQSLARPGFTLVELLVSLALSVFVMAILSEAFVKGLEVFHKYKALSDLENRLRSAANLLRRDLQAPHFEGNKRLSECTVSGRPFPRLEGLRSRYDRSQLAAVAALYEQLKPFEFQSPKLGFFSVEEWPNRPHPTVPRRTMFDEGNNVPGNLRNSYRDEYDVLHFTARLDGNEPDKYFYGRVARAGALPSILDGIGMNAGRTRFDLPANELYSSQAAELLYFVGDDETIKIPGVGQPGGPVRTFNLYRQAWLVIPDRFSNFDEAFADTRYASEQVFLRSNHISAVPGRVGLQFAMFFNTLADVQHRPRRRLAGAAPAVLPADASVPASSPRVPRTLPNGQLDGTDILLTNVISFDVKVFDPLISYKRFDNPDGTAIGRGQFVDIGDTWQMPPLPNDPRMNLAPTAATDPREVLLPVFGSWVNTFVIPNPEGNNPPFVPLPEYFDTGTTRIEGEPGTWYFTRKQSPPTHRYPFNAMQITIRVFDPNTQQTRQITITQDM